MKEKKKKAYVALVDTLGVKGGRWFSGEVRMLTDEQAKPKLEKGRIARFQMAKKQ